MTRRLAVVRVVPRCARMLPVRPAFLVGGSRGACVPAVDRVSQPFVGRRLNHPDRQPVQSETARAVHREAISTSAVHRAVHRGEIGTWILYTPEGYQSLHGR